MSDELSVLRLISIKGRVGADAIAESLGVESAALQPVLDELLGMQLIKETPLGYRITADGRARCTDLVSQERGATDQSAVTAIYDEFTVHNDDLKKIITDWQTRDGQPNDHADADYDAAVLDRLGALHQQVGPLVDRIVGTAPRLTHYRARLNRAAAAAAAGDLTFVSRPILDSYHTVWFELHEDLIGLSGRTREEEAAAGRGA